VCSSDLADHPDPRDRMVVLAGREVPGVELGHSAALMHEVQFHCRSIQMIALFLGAGFEGPGPM